MAYHGQRMLKYSGQRVSDICTLAMDVDLSMQVVLSQE